MQASVTSYHLHKDGGAVDEYEDAFKSSASGDVDIATLGIAISDGASESVLAGQWARLLVEHFVSYVADAAGSAVGFAQHAATASLLWESGLIDYIAGREAEGRPIRWYEQPKIDRGAYATLLTVNFSVPRGRGDRTREPDEGTWTAAAIGDCALFHVREDELITAFPMTAVADFGFSPALLNSRNRDVELIAERTHVGSGTVRQQDDIYLCTDAVAAWFLDEAERGRRPWKLFKDLGTGEGQEFADLIADERAAGRMRNDDATLIHVAVW